MGLFGDNVHKFNEDFLKEKGYGFIKRGEFIKFMKSRGLKYKKDKITDELFEQYLQSEYTSNDFNEDFLKERGIGFVERSEVSRFMESIGLNYRKDKLTEELFEQYLQSKEKEEAIAYDFNNNFLKDKNVGFVEKGAVISFMESIGLNYRKNKLTEELFDQYLQSKRQQKYLKYEEKSDKEKEKLEKIGVVGYDFECDLHERRMNIFGQRTVETYRGYCFVEADRLIVKKRSLFREKDVGDKVLPYAKINAIDYDKATLFHVTSSIVMSVSGLGSVVLKYTSQENFQQLHDAWLNYNTKPVVNQNPQIIEKNTTSNADELLKYAELYEKGLLTKEEFESKKAELLGTNSTQELEYKQPIESDNSRKLDLAKTCPNCGEEIETNSKFCNNCGFKL